MIRGSIRWWERQLKERPYSSNIAFGCTITSLGDFMAQKAEARQREQQRQEAAEKNTAPDQQQRDSKQQLGLYRTAEFNPVRTSIYASLTLIITPLWLHVMNMGDKVLKGQPPSYSRAFKHGFLTWCCGTVLVPINMCYLTVAFNYFVHGVQDFGEIKKRVLERWQNNYFAHITASLLFWSVHWIPLFYYLPTHMRLTYGSLANLLWHSIASWIQHRTPRTTTATTTMTTSSSANTKN